MKTPSRNYRLELPIRERCWVPSWKLIKNNDDDDDNDNDQFQNAFLCAAIPYIVVSSIIPKNQEMQSSMTKLFPNLIHRLQHILFIEKYIFY